MINERKPSERKSLFHRSKLMGVDIADALENIVSRDDGSLPMAVSKDQVVGELVVLANTDDEGVCVQISESSRTFTIDRYRESLATSKVFQSGYEQYAVRSNKPVIPVTDYFFNHVYDDEARDCLDAMISVDLTQSLPKRPSTPYDAAGVPIKDENGDYGIPSGKIAGVVVFPVGSRAALLAKWEDRKMQVTLGHIDKSMASLGRVKPDSKRLAQAQESAVTLKHNVKLALPKPKPLEE